MKVKELLKDFYSVRQNLSEPNEGYGLMLKDNSVIVATKDYDCEITNKSNFTIENLDVSVRVKKLIVNLLELLDEDEEVDIRKEKERILITTKRGGRYYFPCLGWYYEDLREGIENVLAEFEISNTDLYNMMIISRVLRKDNFNNYASVMLVEIDNKLLQCTATDGNLLIHREISIDNDAELKICLDRMTCEKILSFIKNNREEEKAKIMINDKEFCIKYNDKKAFISRTVSLRYPDYRGIKKSTEINEGAQYEQFTVSRQSLQHLISAAGKSQSVRFYSQNEIVYCHAESYEEEIEINVEVGKGNISEMRVLINALRTYLILTDAQDDTITIRRRLDSRIIELLAKDNEYYLISLMKENKQ